MFERLDTYIVERDRKLDDIVGVGANQESKFKQPNAVIMRRSLQESIPSCRLIRRHSVGTNLIAKRYACSRINMLPRILDLCVVLQGVSLSLSPLLKSYQKKFPKKSLIFNNQFLFKIPSKKVVF